MTDETIERVAKAIASSHFSPAVILEDGWFESLSNVVRNTAINQARAALSAIPQQEVSVKDAAKVLLAACPNPIFDNLKYHLLGEFKETITEIDEDGEEQHRDVTIEWNTTKDIISAALSALSNAEGDT